MLAPPRVTGARNDQHSSLLQQFQPTIRWPPPIETNYGYLGGYDDLAEHPKKQGADCNESSEIKAAGVPQKGAATGAYSARLVASC